MLLDNKLRLFGTPARSRVLLTIALLEQSYPTEIAQIAGVHLLSAQRIVNDLEQQGVIASRLLGNQREVRLNQRYFAFHELRDLLIKLRHAEPEIDERIASIRRRARRAGKPL